MVVDRSEGVQGALARHQAISSSAGRDVGVGLCLRREQPESDQRLGTDADAWSRREADRQGRRVNDRGDCMRWMPVVRAVAAAGSLLVAQPLLAHHSAAMFDDTKVVELKGAVKELQWTNPHIWLQLVVEEKGAATRVEHRRGQPQHAVASRVAEHDVQARGRGDGQGQPDEGRYRRPACLSVPGSPTERRWGAGSEHQAHEKTVASRSRMALWPSEQGGSILSLPRRGAPTRGRRGTSVCRELPPLVERGRWDRRRDGRLGTGSNERCEDHTLVVGDAAQNSLSSGTSATICTRDSRAHSTCSEGDPMAATRMPGTTPAFSRSRVTSHGVSGCASRRAGH